jgi:hypothetical protein
VESLAVTECAVAETFDEITKLASKVPLDVTVIDAGLVLTDAESSVSVTVEPAVKPVPVTETVDPAWAEVGLSWILAVVLVDPVLEDVLFVALEFVICASALFAAGINPAVTSADMTTIEAMMLARTFLLFIISAPHNMILMQYSS